MKQYKKVIPLDDFNWSEFENGTTIGASKDELDKAYDETLNKVSEHQVVDGTVISVDKKEVVVNIGYKSDGIIPASEFHYNPDLKVGDKVEVYVESAENKKGRLILSHKKARIRQYWDSINKAFEEQSVIKGFVKCRTAGGMIVEMLGIEAFLPLSQIDSHPYSNYDEYVKKDMDFKILMVDQINLIVVVSHKIISEPFFRMSSILKELEKYEDVLMPNEYDYDDFLNDNYESSRSPEKHSTGIPDKSEMVRTYGRFSPCPHCGSNSVRTYSDGTAQCNNCHKWYNYS